VCVVIHIPSRVGGGAQQRVQLVVLHVDGDGTAGQGCSTAVQNVLQDTQREHPANITVNNNGLEPQGLKGLLQATWLQAILPSCLTHRPSGCVRRVMAPMDSLAFLGTASELTS
jgi:hypothetical protein